MKVIVCLDDNGGMMFNSRRQSRDRAVTADILRTVVGARLYIDPYSEKLFLESGGEYSVSDRMLDEASKGDVCFVENKELSDYADRIEEIVIYRWNRRYPADRFFDIDLEKQGFKRVDTEEFEGYSHEKITKEIFRR